MASPTSIFTPASTPAQSIFGLSVFVLMTVAVVFIVVFSLLAYSVVRFRDRHDDDRSEPPQIYGSNQVELAWTVIHNLNLHVSLDWRVFVFTLVLWHWRRGSHSASPRRSRRRRWMWLRR